MQIIDTQAFDEPAHVQLGDTLTVTHYDDNGVVIVSFTAEIKKKQLLNRAVLVEYTSDEAAALGLKSAFGTFVGAQL